MLDRKQNAGYQYYGRKPDQAKDNELEAPIVRVEVAAWRAGQKGLSADIEPNAGNGNRKRRRGGMGGMPGAMPSAGMGDPYGGLPTYGNEA